MYVLPEALRSELARPLAPPLATAAAVAKVRQHRGVASVGDVVTEMLLDAGIVPHLAVVDFKTRRGEADFGAPLHGKIERAFPHRERFENPAATITQTLWDAVGAALKRREASALEIVGEEDLAVLPVVAMGPDGMAVVYGQPGEGAVVLTVNADLRKRIGEYLSKMDVRGTRPRPSGA